MIHPQNNVLQSNVRFQDASTSSSSCVQVDEDRDEDCDDSEPETISHLHHVSSSSDRPLPPSRNGLLPGAMVESIGNMVAPNLRRVRSKSVLVPSAKAPRVSTVQRGSLQSDIITLAERANRAAVANSRKSGQSSMSSVLYGRQVDRLRSASLGTTRSQRSTRDSTISDMCVDLMKVNRATLPFGSAKCRSLSSTTAKLSPDGGGKDCGVGGKKDPAMGLRDNGGHNPGSGAQSTVPNFSVRHSKRNLLFAQRKQLSDYALVFGMSGILLMVLETEMTLADVYNKESTYSKFVKTLISITTVVLLGIMFAYHRLEIQLFAVNNCIEDWRIAISGPMLIQIVAELLVCAVHPLPVSVYFTWTTVLPNERTVTSAKVPVDLIFSLPMFLRLYLICRTMLLHSMLFSDAASRSIGALNRINFDTKFVVKTLMTMYPGTVLLVFMLSLCLVASWTLRICESFHDKQFENLFNSIWFIAVSFLSIGYGDIVPHSYCGRGIAVSTGVMGSFCTALVVAVLARKLELTRAEKFVHNFMMDNQLTKKLKNAAANVLRETWLIYKYTKIVKNVNGHTVRRIQRKFLHAIHSLRNVKLQIKSLNDDTNSLVDLSQTQTGIYDLLLEISSRQNQNEEQFRRIDQYLMNVQAQMNALPDLVIQSLLARRSLISGTEDGISVEEI